MEFRSGHIYLKAWQFSWQNAILRNLHKVQRSPHSRAPQILSFRHKDRHSLFKPKLPIAALHYVITPLNFDDTCYIFLMHGFFFVKRVFSKVFLHWEKSDGSLFCHWDNKKCRDLRWLSENDQGVFGGPWAIGWDPYLHSLKYFNWIGQLRHQNLNIEMHFRSTEFSGEFSCRNKRHVTKSKL